MNLPKLTDLDVSGKRVIVRMDLDVEDDYTRLEFAEETLDYLVSKMARLIIIGHKGEALKKTATEARKDLESFFGKKVFMWKSERRR